MLSVAHIVLLLFCSILTAQALPLNDERILTPTKRLSNDALIRLMIRYQNNHNNMMALKRHEKRAEFERRSVDDDFSNCFLSPVQCMLPSARR